MFRLVRRLVVCLILGVTVFGAVGWLSLPRPTWTTTIGAGLSNVRFAPRYGGDFHDDEPIWVLFATVEPGAPHGIRQFAESRSATDGQRMRRLDDCKPVLGVRANGVLITHELEGRDETPTAKTTFEACGAQPNDSTISATFDGRWYTSNGGRAWKQKATLQGLTISIADLASMSVVRSRSIQGNFISHREDFTISQNARLLAVSDRTKHGRSPPYGFEVLDLETGDVAFRMAPQKDYAEGGGRYGFISMNDEALHYVWHFDRTATKNTIWKLDFASGAARQVSLKQTVEPPEGFAAPPGKMGEVTRNAGGVWIFEGPSEMWFRVEAGREAKAPWRKVPFAVGEAAKLGRQLKGATPGSPRIEMIPERTAFIWTNREPPLTSLIPQPVRRFAPTSWQNDQAILKHRWHDWSTGEWRDAGGPPELVDRQMRPGSMLTLTQTTGGVALLQSWRLPPRDPRWPAGGAAAATFGLTWLFCRWRAKRKLATASA